MSSTFGRIGFSCLAMCAVTAELAAQQMPNYEMRIVAKNDVAIVPFVTTIAAVPGDRIDVDVFLSEWSPAGEKLRAWQWVLDSATTSGGIRGSVGPIQGLRACTTFAECAGLLSPGANCLGTGFCDTAPDRFAAGASLDTTRGDRIYCEEIGGFLVCLGQIGPFSDVSSPSIRFNAAVLQESDSPAYGPPPGTVSTPQYAGTLHLVVSPDACGTFNLGFLESGTIMQQPGLGDFITPLRLDGITIEAPSAANCSCTRVLTDPTTNELVAIPLPCSIDAGQPSEPDGAMPAGLNSIALQFDCPTTAGIAQNAENFVLREVPFGFFPPFLQSIVADDPAPGWLRVVFRDPFATEKWTCVRYTVSGQEICVGSLPADVNASQTSNVDDIFAAVDCFDGTTACDDSQCDVDRSGSCAPGDMLRVIDLLNGADTYDIWNNAQLPFLAGCPAP